MKNKEKAATYSGKSTTTFTNCSTATNKSNNKQKRPHSYDDDCWNECIDIFKEVIIIIIGNENIGSHVAQNTCCCLQKTKDPS